MKLLYEQSLLYGEQFFSDFDECESFETHQLQPQQLRGVDALLVRSTTTVDAALLRYADQLSFVATGTAGFDHLDCDLLADRDIGVFNAAGCNAISVAEYVMSCLIVGCQQLGHELSDITVGIVGAGHVGSAVEGKLRALNVAYKLCDPLLASSQSERQFCSLDEIFGCDIVTLHVPWTTTGAFATDGFIDHSLLSSLGHRQILINACRGEVIDADGLQTMLQRTDRPRVFLDVWHDEPNIDKTILPLVDIATPHIAGHSLEGKARGTELVYRALTKHFAVAGDKKIADFLPKPDVKSLTLNQSVLSWETLSQLMLLQYDCQIDDRCFRRKTVNNVAFSLQRKQYRMRREYSALNVECIEKKVVDQLTALGFSAQLISR